MAGLLAGYLSQLPSDVATTLSTDPNSMWTDPSTGNVYGGTWLDSTTEGGMTSSFQGGITGLPPAPDSGYAPGTTEMMYSPSGAFTGTGATMDGGGFEAIDLAPLAIAGLGMAGAFGGGADAASTMSSFGAGDSASIDSLFASPDSSFALGGDGLMGGGLGGMGGWGGLIGPLTQLAGGALGLNAAKKGNNLLNSILPSLLHPNDPFGPYRAGYANQLQQLMADPKGSVANLPGYQAGLDAVQRSMAANGYLGSGNMMAAMLQYGGNAWQQQAQLLAELAGAQFAPAQVQGGALNGLLGAAGQINATNSNSWMNILKGIGGLAPSIMSGMGSMSGAGDAMSSFDTASNDFSAFSDFSSF